MSAAPSSLEIHVHGLDGEVSRFAQHDAAAAQKLFEHIHPGKVFSQRQLMIASGHSFAVFPTAAIARLDLVMEGHPDWEFHYGASDIQEVTAEEFRERYHPEQFDPSHPLPPGAPVVGYAEIELTNGEHVHVEVHTRVEQRLPLEQALFLQQIFAAHSLYSRRRGGGAILLNPQHIVRLTLYPGPQSTPPNALSAEPLAR